MGILVKFYGGPKDGEVMRLPDLRRWHVPASDHHDRTPGPVHVYEPAYDSGEPMSDEAGHYRYDYQGRA